MHKHYFKQILESHLLGLDFGTANLHPVPPVMRLAGITPPGMILRLPSAAWDCYSPFCARTWVKGEWIHRSVVLMLWGGCDMQRGTGIRYCFFTLFPNIPRLPAKFWHLESEECRGGVFCKLSTFNPQLK